MITTYVVTFPDGASRSVTTMDEVAALVSENPQVQVKSHVRFTPCSEHRAYEAANCPLCGTSAQIG